MASPASEMAAFDRDIKRVWFTLHRAHANELTAKRMDREPEYWFVDPEYSVPREEKDG